MAAALNGQTRTIVLAAVLLTVSSQALPPTPQPGMENMQCTFGDNGTTVTRTSGDCNGWPSVTMDACFQYCYQNQLPSGCVRPEGYQCSTVIYEIEPSPSPWKPGWCHNTNSSCVAMPGDSTYLFENVTNDTFVCLNGTCVPSAGGGVPEGVCEHVCINPGDAKYVCHDNKCLVSTDPNRGADKATCEAICKPPSGKP